MKYELSKAKKEYVLSSAYYNILSGYYYRNASKNLSKGRFLKIYNIWNNVVTQEIKNNTLPEQFEKKYRLKMKLTPIKEL